MKFFFWSRIQERKNAISEMEERVRKARHETLKAENKLRDKLDVRMRDLERVPVAAAFVGRKHNGR